ncbi:tRNA (adenosine(37)-N6)-threonylcarbamoyltransferase complex dimerization subunit type 1 TsaB [Companilactobacillus alimentarius]|uniref:tRNA (Adenosine(37)-N6)-threonylcarbamoyltransferase complex dimerization subunit type 1 TsaB n=1 Tax=Companilactobacillus alimentarius DSM 20249 TaxID=1423720 RepID=A0A2K9HJI7_9LACO|nr:tRNA (adenosine(37)-N6)-threonylcarbamoyltransferase complex dimerization subunit type 1 TsaB [Companilactobacillus alimentarius]AUI72704.1 tRNA (adenosine(37)-N6)-threonylcarbamoyltransferase complex dimerization subunit type 1 TsaB [Companilactobacillus alimentarius DSM 20249]KRK75606.1 glycoprotein endopeptidase [Companilactobacillus alimentarius DSM 20249]MDT6952133.1 tRNA (adenosine(37)-N6)-threonylcarbamoyltransferase complex dimerization subunit type 1 TsaB [Companilactobacillus alimen
MKILAFDTSNKPLSVAVVVDGKILAHVESTEQKTHSVTLLPDIKKSLQESNLTMDEIDLIAVAKGPGSYTGVRIAVTVAKTLADTLNKKLVGVSSLKLLAANGDKKHILVPLMDARNDNAYAGVYVVNRDNRLLTVIDDHHTPMKNLFESLDQFESHELEFINATPKLQELIKARFPKATIIPSENSAPDAAKLAKIAETTRVVKDIDSFIPTYLRLTQAEHDWYAKGNKEDKNVSYVEEV